MRRLCHDAQYALCGIGLSIKIENVIHDLCYSVRTNSLKRKRADFCSSRESTLNPQPSIERMKIVLNHNSAVEREETPHTTNPTQNDTLKGDRCIAVAFRRRAESVLRDRSVDAQSRALIRYRSGDE